MATPPQGETPPFGRRHHFCSGFEERCPPLDEIHGERLDDALHLIHSPQEIDPVLRGSLGPLDHQEGLGAILLHLGSGQQEPQCFDLIQHFRQSGKACLHCNHIGRSIQQHGPAIELGDFDLATPDGPCEQFQGHSVCTGCMNLDHVGVITPRDGLHIEPKVQSLGRSQFQCLEERFVCERATDQTHGKSPVSPLLGVSVCVRTLRVEAAFGLSRRSVGH